MLWTHPLLTLAVDRPASDNDAESTADERSHVACLSKPPSYDGVPHDSYEDNEYAGIPRSFSSEAWSGILQSQSHLGMIFLELIDH